MNKTNASAPVPHYARPSLATRIALAWAAVACSAFVICAGLGLFEMQARAANAAHQLETTMSAGTPGGVQAANVPRSARRG